MKRTYAIGDVVKGGEIVGIPEDLPGFYNIKCLKCGTTRIKSPRKSGCRQCNILSRSWSKYSIGSVVESGVIVDYANAPGRFVIQCKVCGNTGVRQATSTACSYCWNKKRSKYNKGDVLEDGRTILDVDRSGTALQLKVACKYCNSVVWKYRGSVNAKCSTCRYISKVDLALNKKLASYKAGAKKRDYVWSISDETAKKLFQTECFYCGAQPHQLNGIDRMNNAIGYEEGNVVSCCKQCNYAKRDTPYDEWNDWMNRVSLKFLARGGY